MPVRQQMKRVEEKMTLEALLARQKFGLLLRVFAPKPKVVAQTVKSVMTMVKKALAVTINDVPLFSRINVVVWADTQYSGADCGATHPTLIAAIGDQLSTVDSERVFTHYFTRGDLYCGTLNWGVAMQHLAHGMHWTFMWSHTAASYMNSATCTAMLEQAAKGALVVGCAIDEIAPLIRRGRVANTAALWHGPNLMSVGGFGLRAAMPISREEGLYIYGCSQDGSPVFYPAAGVEEIEPLVHLVKVHGPCIAVVDPVHESGEVARYEVPADPEMRAKNQQKFATKKGRQDARLAGLGCDETFLECGLMSG